ncbi:MAG: hypothetical protein RLZZ546_2961 [Bacteroidota bacterium]|jgi:dTDP-4-amino-4,6-dideoxygalactose transaminase
MNEIPFFDHKVIHEKLQHDILSAVKKVLESNSIVLGHEVTTFENRVNNYLGSRYAIGVNSGLDAMILSLKVAGVKEGDEVIVPSNTYIATWLAVTQAGAMPIPVEPKLDTYNIDESQIQRAITSKTKAILPVHLYGLPCEMYKIMQIAHEYKLIVIEDNAQAFGVDVSGIKTGNIGDINALSFYPTKNLGAIGDAGMIITDNEDYYEKCKSLRNYGSSIRYFNDYLGYNSRMDEIQAAILNVKLEYIDQWIDEKRKMAAIYNEGLKHINGLKLPIEAVNHSYHLYVVKCDSREELMQHLIKNKISTLIHYPVPPHLQLCYKFLGYNRGDFPIAEHLADTLLSLPMYIGLKDQAKVIEAIIEFYK